MPFNDETLYWRVRIREDLRTKLKNLAKINQKPLTYFISEILEDYLYNEEKK